MDFWGFPVVEIAVLILLFTAAEELPKSCGKLPEVKRKPMIADAFRNIARFYFLYFLLSRWAPETESADLG